MRRDWREYFQLRGGGILYKGNQLDLPGFEFLDALGSGANGVVFLVKNKWLNREEALKIWLALRDKDDRDKIAQGMLEAQKLADAECDAVIPIYAAGTIEGQLFYSTMQYVRGPSLRQVLKHPDLTPQHRLLLGRKYGTALHEIADLGLVHGDPHDGNILLRFDLPPLGTIFKDYHELQGIGPLVLAKPVFCDFGVSKFMKRGSIRARHWRVSRETILRILQDNEILSLFDKHPIPKILNHLNQAKPLEDAKSNERASSYRANPRQVAPFEIVSDSLYAQQCFQLANFATKLWRREKGLPPLGAWAQ